jgi:membrane-bound lytic murein transglycosylase D
MPAGTQVGASATAPGANAASTSGSSTGDTQTAATTPSAAGSGSTDGQAVQYTNLWQRIRAGYGLPHMDNARVERQEQWYASNPAYMKRLVERARLYLYYIVQQVQKRHMPMEIALLPAIESAYKPHALSHARAAGLWQFIPSTGRHFGLHRNWWYDGRRDVVAATGAALDYLEKLHDDFHGDWELALAAYNAGERRVLRAQEYNRRHGLPTDYAHLRHLKAETRNYVPKLIAMANIVADPQKFGLTLASIPNSPYFAKVEIASQIDLGVVAKLADMSIGDLYDINPGFKRWATSPNGPHELLVPAERRDALLAALKNLPQNKRVRWVRHHVRRGETLSGIARHYRISVHAIRNTNRMHSNWIRAGQNLIIPVSNRRLSASVGNITRPYVRPVRILRRPKGTVKLIHTVHKGDTLWDIARRYDVYIYQITGWNRLRRYRPLHPGQELKIYVDPDHVPQSMADAAQPN